MVCKHRPENCVNRRMFVNVCIRSTQETCAEANKLKIPREKNFKYIVNWFSKNGDSFKHAALYTVLHNLVKTALKHTLLDTLQNTMGNWRKSKSVFMPSGGRFCRGAASINRT